MERGCFRQNSKKPSLFYRCKNNIKFLVQKIESLNKKDFSILTTFLLNYNCHTQSFIKNEIDNILNLKRSDFALYNKEKNIGVIFISKKNYNYRIKELCELYAYERKINNWFIVIIDKNFVDFERYYYEDKSNNILEQKLEQLKKYRLEQTLKVKKKIGRNEPCPCASGKKYKKCCGK